jgi:hypothetical protein
MNKPQFKAIGQLLLPTQQIWLDPTKNNPISTNDK